MENLKAEVHYVYDTDSSYDEGDGALSVLRDYPAEELAKHIIKRRAIETVIWACRRSTSIFCIRAGSAGGAWNQVVYWSRLPDWKNQTLTPNPNVIYVFPFFDTRKWGRW